jgi:hemerythrin-like domain-containing protein
MMASTARMPADMEFMNRLFHTALRRDLSRTLDALTATQNRTPGQHRALAEHLGLVLDLLHHHHTSEDEGLWPLVRRRAPDLAAQLDMMEAEHAAVAGAIDSTRAATIRYSSDPASGRDDLRKAVRALQDTLLPHLDHEETEVMPRVMRALSRQDWSALARREVQNTGSFALAGTGLLWTVDGLDPERRAQFNRQVPALFRWLIDKRYGRAYRRRTALAFDITAESRR